MTRVLSSELSSHVGQRVHVAGWLHHQRRLSQVSFLLIRDRSGITQVVLEDADARDSAGELLNETVVEITGHVVESGQAPAGVELINPELSVLSAPDVQPPFELRRPELAAQLPTMLDHAAVALRHPRRRAVAALAAASVRGFRTVMDGAGFTEIHTPKVVASATEGGANVFPIDWFGREAFLAQSPQFYKQIMVGALERVYEVGPVFRAEPHDTARHLAQYLSLDAEMGFVTDHRDVMAMLRDVIESMLQAGDTAAQELDLSLPAVPQEIPAIDFVEAQHLIETSLDEDVVGQPDLTPAHERWLGDWAAREHGSEFVFVTGYPMAKRPFYTHPNPSRPEVSNSFDLLFRGLELVTGGQRLHLYADYVGSLEGQSLTAFEGYLEAFRHGMPPHGGFAIGLERWISRLTGAANVREVTLFPRDLHRLTP